MEENILEEFDEKDLQDDFVDSINELDLDD